VARLADASRGGKIASRSAEVRRRVRVAASRIFTRNCLLRAALWRDTIVTDVTILRYPAGLRLGCAGACKEDNVVNRSVLLGSLLVAASLALVVVPATGAAPAVQEPDAPERLVVFELFNRSESGG
jgi:hypothetical protein